MGETFFLICLPTFASQSMLIALWHFKLKRLCGIVITWLSLCHFQGAAIKIINWTILACSWSKFDFLPFQQYSLLSSPFAQCLSALWKVSRHRNLRCRRRRLRRVHLITKKIFWLSSQSQVLFFQHNLDGSHRNFSIPRTNESRMRVRAYIIGSIG